MNWFAIGGGIALIILGLTSLRPGAGRPARLPRATAVTLGLVGLAFLILGATPGLLN